MELQKHPHSCRLQVPVLAARSRPRQPRAAQPAAARPSLSGGGPPESIPFTQLLAFRQKRSPEGMPVDRGSI